MKKCLRKKCQKEFEPNKPKQVFCSAKCRVYFSREEKEVKISDLNIATNKIQPAKAAGSESTNFTINTKEKKGEDAPDPTKDKAAYLKWLRGNN